MKSHPKWVLLAPQQLVIGFLASMVVASAVAATEPPESDSASGQQADSAPPKKPGKHKHSHASRPLPKAPLGQERVPSQPLPPLPSQR